MTAIDYQLGKSAEMGDIVTITARRFFAPEVVQTSAMDCGPAALKCLLEGFDIAASYGRLREACQTDVDGTSINRIEDVAQQVGLLAQQVLAPVDHLFLPAAQLLPALVVTVQPSGATHFVVVWRKVGRWVQVMDPATGRRWVNQIQFAQEIYRHQLWLSAGTWRTWAGSTGFCDPLRARLRDLGLTEMAINRLVEDALADPAWRPLAALDATTRFVASVKCAQGVTRGAEATRLVENFFAQARQAGINTKELIPATFWSVQPLPATTNSAEPAEALLLLQGAVLIQVRGRQTKSPDGYTPTSTAQTADNETLTGAPTPLSPDLAAALVQPANAHLSEPIVAVIRALRGDGLLTPSLLSLAALLAALGVMVEALLLRGLLTLNSGFGQGTQRTLLAVGVLLFSLGLFLLEAPQVTIVRRMGRRLEIRLRIALLEKIPRLGDQYFHSRLISDMTHRAYSLQQLHSLPGLAVNVLRQSFQLLFTAIGIIWLAPASLPLTLLVTGFAMGSALFSQPLLAEYDLRVRTQASALSRFYLDALLGLLPIRAHSAERAVRREHELLLVEWMRASWGLAQIEMLLQGMVALIGLGGAGWVVERYLAGGGEAGGVLLLLYWALSLPALGQALVTSMQQYPMVHNHLLRLLEPLGAPEEGVGGRGSREVEEQGREAPSPPVAPTPPLPHPTAGVAIQMTGVVVHAGGHTVLREIDLMIAPGEHVAIVGPSGAGKSSLAGLLLGWLRPAAGQLWVDGAPLRGEQLQALRRGTAWVDPAVQLWNRTLDANLRYGLAGDASEALDDVLIQANLYEILEKLPDGLQTTLGEGGGLVSGGEGQRVRLGRALLRPNVRLAILDEPFRGLDRRQRQQLLANARRHWQAVTLLCITHDMAETQDFDRVLVMDGGRIVEDGAPQALAADAQSRYCALLTADAMTQQAAWADMDWRRLWLEEGQLREL